MKLFLTLSISKKNIKFHKQNIFCSRISIHRWALAHTTFTYAKKLISCFKIFMSNLEMDISKSNSDLTSKNATTNQSKDIRNENPSKSGRNVSLPWDDFQVNHAKQILSIYNYPKSVSYPELLATEGKNEKLSNFHKFDCFDWKQNVKHSNYKDLVYDTRGVSKGKVVLLYSSFGQNMYKNTIRELFKENLNFTFQPYIISNKSSFEPTLNHLKSDIEKSTNCFVLFILAEYSNDSENASEAELIFKNNQKVKVDKLISYFNGAKDLVNKPKLIFIQNSGEKSPDINFEIQNDFLFLICSVVRESTTINRGFHLKDPDQAVYLKIKTPQEKSFIVEFCQLLSDRDVEYDLLTILHKLKLKKTDLSLSIKSTLSKSLFFKKCLTSKNWEIVENDALFYQKGKKRCHLMRYGEECFKEENFKLKDQFKELNFETSTEVIDNDSLKRMLDIDMFQNHYAYDGFFIVLFLNQETNSEYIMDLIDHLADVESLIGKPKVLFLFGPFHYIFDEWKRSIGKEDNNSKKKEFTEEEFKQLKNNSNVKLSKHADLMVFHSEQVTDTIDSINEVFGDKNNVNQYDLISLLLMVSSDVESKNEKAKLEGTTLGISKNPICINSTLTRLVSLSINESVISEKDFKLPDSIFKVLPEEKRGKCYIFNYETYENNYNIKRTCATNDEKKLSDTFKKLKFDVVLHNDLTEAKTITEVTQINRDGQECLVVFILTHGSDLTISCHDQVADRNEIITIIAENKAWDGKPKFIFFETCRGARKEKIVGNLEGDILPRANSPLAKYPDMFIFFPTFEGHVSWFDGEIPEIENSSDEAGSWSIMKLCDRLDRDYNKYDIFTIATLVSRDICRHYGGCLITPKGVEPKKCTLAKETPTSYSTLKHAYSLSLKN